MNNPEYNIRIQNDFHSDKLNSLLDSEYMLPLYYNTLYDKIDKLLAGGEGFDYDSNHENEIDDEDLDEDFSEVDLDNSDEIFNSTEKSKNKIKGFINAPSSFQKGSALVRKQPVQKFRINSPDKGGTKGREVNYEFDPEQEKKWYEETIALIDEELDGFEDPEEFESELPQRIIEAASNLNERLKYLNKDEFGDPIIEDGYFVEPQGKNLQASALRLTNLLGTLFKKSPMPEFQSQLTKLLSNFSQDGSKTNEGIKNSGLKDKGILGLLQKHIQKSNSSAKSISNGADSPPRQRNPTRHHSVMFNDDASGKFKLI
jgi:hypothetical protein